MTEDAKKALITAAYIAVSAAIIVPTVYTVKTLKEKLDRHNGKTIRPAILDWTPPVTQE